MPDVIKRLKYYNGQFLQEPDFTAEQEYHLDRQRRHHRQLHTPGIADGLAVTVGTTSVSVAPGTAIDGQGRQIVLSEARTVGFASSLNGQSALVVISYAEEPADDATVGDAGKTRWKEVPLVDAILESGAPPPSDRIPLARLQISSTGTVTQQDLTVRAPAGARLRPEEALERLRLSRQGVSASQWPVLSSGAANQADLAGNLSVTGNILVTGTVDGRDVSADGAKLDTLGLSTIAGVSNPGGNIIVSGQNGITISGNDATNTITIGVGAPASIDGVSNAGGNIDLVAGTNVAITPDNTSNKRITIAGSSIAGVSNPGGDIAVNGTGGISVVGNDAANTITIGTSPAAIGALASSDYLRRTQTTVYFGNGDADGATRTVNVGFQPRLLVNQGRIWAYVNGYYGGLLGGSYDPAGPSSMCSGPVLYRYTTSPFVSFYYEVYSGYLAYSYFFDYTATPYNHVTLFVSVDSVSSTGFTLRLSRTTYSGYNTPSFSLGLNLVVLG